MSKHIDLTGKQFGRWLVVEEIKGRWGPECVCICSCKEKTQRAVKRSNLQSGRSKSCGCLAIELTKKRNPIYKTTHGMTNSPEYKAWSSMKSRCYKEDSHNYPNYGGRGITVCDEWRDSFEKFLEDLGPRPDNLASLDRIDPDKGYSPENCRWADKKTQARNIRNNYLYKYNGLELTMSQWIAYIKSNATRSEPVGV